MYLKIYSVKHRSLGMSFLALCHGDLERTPVLHGLSGSEVIFFQLSQAGISPGLGIALPCVLKNMWGGIQEDWGTLPAFSGWWCRRSMMHGQAVVHREAFIHQITEATLLRITVDRAHTDIIRAREINDWVNKLHAWRIRKKTYLGVRHCVTL